MATNPTTAPTHSQIARGRRTHPRARVALSGLVETIDGVRPVKVHNLSSTGAMVETPRVPEIGRDLVFKCFGIDAFGVVIWEHGDCCGIEFYDQVEEGEIVRHRHLSDDEFEQQKWRTRQEILDAARRWSAGKSA